MIWFGSSNIGEVDSHRGLVFEVQNMPTIGKVMEQIQHRLMVLGEVIWAVAAFQNAWGSIRTRNSNWQTRVSFTPLGLSERRMIASVSHVAIVLMLIT